VFFDLYGTLGFLPTAIAGVAVYLCGGIGLTGDASIDGWLPIACLPPYWGYLFDRCERRGFLRSYRTLLADALRDPMNVRSAAWRRLTLAGAPLILNPWVALGFGVYHSWAAAWEPSSVPVRFTGWCALGAVLSLIFGLLTQRLRYVNLEGIVGHPGEPQDELTASQIEQFRRRMWVIPTWILITANVVLATAFVVLLFLI
jgi:hypothetical protein